MSTVEKPYLAVDAPAAAVGPHAAGVRWNLNHIFNGIDAARVGLDDVLSRAMAFESQYRGRVASLEGPALATAMQTLGDLRNDYSRVDQYTGLRYSIDSRDTDTKDMLDACAKSQEELQNRLRFFDLEWQSLAADVAAARAADNSVAPYRHALERLTAYAPHMRTEHEESMLAARETAAIDEWQKLFSENVDKIEVEFDGGKGIEKHTLDRLFAYSRHPQRDVRFKAYHQAYEQLAPRVDVQAACYNAIVGDRLQIDRIRGFNSPMQATNLANDLPDSVVDALIESVKKHYPLAQRWFHIKAGLLNLPKLHLFDQYAPLGTPREIEWEEAWSTFADGTRLFSSDVEGMLTPLVGEGRIDAEPRTGKRGGAFCAPVAWGTRPYILMNFTDDARSIETLAHEAGHALHFLLAGRDQPPVSARMGLAMAEVASTFHETVLVDYVLEHEQDVQQRRLLTAGSIEGAFATIFRQTMMTGYEQRAYALKASGKALTADRLSDIWFEENASYYGDAVELPTEYRCGWSYIPHFIDTRFYTYAYSFAHLVSMALYAKYREDGPGFIPRYLDLLSAGGSRTPQDLLAGAGIDITDPKWLEPSFAQIERMISLAEEAA
jgi:oligoendopeptidase F